MVSGKKKSQKQAFLPSHELLGISSNTDEISTFPQLQRRGQMEKWKTKCRFPIMFHYPDALPKEGQNNSDLRIISTHDIYRFGNISW